MVTFDHSHFEELAALAAGGYLSGEELRELREHTLVCEECEQSEADFAEIVRSGLPLTQSPVRELYEKMKSNPGEGARERFLQWLGRRHPRRLDVCEDRRLFHAQTDVQRNAHQEYRQDEWQTPAP